MQIAPSTPKTLSLRRRVAGLAALSSLVMLSLTSQAQAQGMGGPGGMEGMGHHQRGGPAMSAERMAKFAERRIDHIIKEVGGTPEQKDKLMAISKATMADMKPLREQHMQARQKAFALLAAPTIDRAALEQLRTAEMQSADAMSKRMVQSMADSAEVLKPEQRAKLAERMKKWMDRRKP